jgi:hypothetical protein
MDNGRIVFTHPDGVLAVSPDAGHFALTDSDSLQILTAAQFQHLLEESRSNSSPRRVARQSRQQT